MIPSHSDKCPCCVPKAVTPPCAFPILIHDTSSAVDLFDLCFVRPVSIALLAVFSFSLCHGRGVVARFLTKSLPRRFGELSWTFYLLHYMVIKSVGLNPGAPSDSWSGKGTVVVRFLASTAAAWLAQDVLQNRLFVWLRALAVVGGSSIAAAARRCTRIIGCCKKGRQWDINGYQNQEPLLPVVCDTVTCGSVQM